MYPSQYGDARLGSALLRNFYTIYDMKNLKMGFASLTQQNQPKIDPVRGDIPLDSYADYTGDYTLLPPRIAISLAVIIGFAASGLGLIGGISAALFYLVIANDKVDADQPAAPILTPDATAASKPVAKPPTSGSELNL
jgi:hypothetical protein